MNRFFIFLLSSLTIFSASAQRESFDMLSYAPPKDWTKSVNANNVTYSNLNKEKGGFCIIGIYKSVASGSDIQTDFTNQWNDIAVKQIGITSAPAMEPLQEGKGWQAMGGSASFQYQGNNTVAILTILRGKGKTVSIMSMTNIKYYIPIIKNFLATVDENTVVQIDPVVAASNNNDSNNGISTFTTNFDDGWSATAKDDYVLVTKGNYRVYLFYGEQFNDESRKNTVDYFFQHQLTKLFTLTNTVARNDNYHYYLEGDATENATGRGCYIAMDVVAHDGIASTVIAVSPSQADHRSQFGDNLKNFLTYNKFGIAAQDLPGTWRAGGGNTTAYYSYYSGDYVGSTAIVTSDKFIFTGTNGFETEFKGATGVVGNMSTYQQHYKGTFSVPSSWQLSTTDQSNKTVLYDCWFEAVKGGAILHLTDHQYTGNKFDLLKEKN